MLASEGEYLFCDATSNSTLGHPRPPLRTTIRARPDKIVSAEDLAITRQRCQIDNLLVLLRLKEVWRMQLPEKIQERDRTRHSGDITFNQFSRDADTRPEVSMLRFWHCLPIYEMEIRPRSIMDSLISTMIATDQLPSTRRGIWLIIEVGNDLLLGKR